MIQGMFGFRHGPLRGYISGPGMVFQLVLFVVRTRVRTRRQIRQILITITAMACGFAVGGCFNPSTPEELGQYDFISTPITYRVLSATRAPEEMLPSEKVYEFRTCLKDRISLSTLSLNEFAIDGEVYLSNEEGCVVWNHKVDFNPYLQSRSSEAQFEIIGRGKFPGRLLISYELNPWVGVRPTSTTEFVEIVPAGAIDLHQGGELAEGVFTLEENSAGDEDSRKKAVLGVQTVKKSVFFHSDSSRASQGHWNFEITPLLQVYDVRGVQHALVPQNGRVGVALEILSLGKELSFDDENLKKARLVKKMALDDQLIASGKILITEKVRIPDVLEGDNILLRVGIEGSSDLVEDGVDLVSNLYYVRQDQDVEILEEVDLSGQTSESPDLVVQPRGGAHPYYHAENPRVNFVRYLSRSTTQSEYELVLTTRIRHRNSTSVVTNEDLYVTFNGDTQVVSVRSDGLLSFSFKYVYDLYTMLQRPQEVLFTISNKANTFSVEVPLFLKPWDHDAANMALNPETLAVDTVESLRVVEYEKPQVYLDSLSLNPPTLIDYKVFEDLSLGFRYGFGFHATAKVRSKARETFGGTRVLDAPDGRYRLDVYLTCPNEGLKNRQLYSVEVDDALKEVTILRINKEKLAARPGHVLAVEDELVDSYINWDPRSNRGSICPASHTQFDVEVENGSLVGQFIVELPDARLEWTRTQLTAVLTPYETKNIESAVFHTQKLRLSHQVEAAPMGSQVVLEKYTKSPGKVVLEDIRQSEEHSHGLMKSLDEVQLAAKKWDVIQPYYVALSNLESDYLGRFDLNYVSLEGEPYSALPPSVEGVWKCEVGSSDCVSETSSERSLSFQEYQARFLTPNGKTLSVADMRDILHNRPDSRLRDLIEYACYSWSLKYKESIEQYFYKDPASLLWPERSVFEEEREDERDRLKRHDIKVIDGTYGDLMAWVASKVTSLSQRCVKAHSEQHMDSLQDWKNQSMVAVHHLKGPVTRSYPQNAGVDILNYRQTESFAAFSGLEMVASLHTDLLAAVFSVFKSFGLGSLGGYSVAGYGEYEVGVKNDWGGGMTHYSNWTTVQMALQFDQPKYCLTLRMNPKFFLKQMLVDGTPPMLYSYPVSYPPYHGVRYNPLYAQQWYVSFLEDLAEGYLFCTTEQPEDNIIVTDDGERVGLPVVGIEHYRFPAPRFAKPGVFDPTIEHFRSWLYPLRGQSDYLRFIYSLGALDDDASRDTTAPSYFDPRLSLFHSGSRFVNWVYEDDRVDDVQDSLFKTSQSFIKFPKRSVYEEFSSVPPSVGGFYSY